MAERIQVLQRPRTGTQVLVVEKDAAVAARLKACLGGEGFSVTVAETAGAMRAAVARTPVDLVILDVALPDQDGWSALRWLRMRRTVPIIMLTGTTKPVDTTIGLELGADDCLAKPVDPGDLVARIRAIQQRRDDAHAAANTDEAICFADWTLDIVNQQLRSEAGQAMHLTQAEYRILVLLARNPRRVVSRDELMDVATGRDWEPFDRSVDVHISNLRRKIDPDPSQPSLIRTVRGAGYMFVPSRGA